MNSESEQLKKIFGYIEEMNAETEAWKKMFDMQSKLITNLELDKIRLEKEVEELKNKSYNYEQGYLIQSLRADEAEKKAERYRLDANKEMSKRMYWEKDNKLPKPFSS